MPLQEELQFPDTLAVTNAALPYLTAVPANMVRYIWRVETYNTTGGANGLTIGHTDDGGTTHTTCVFIYHAAEHAQHWRPGYEDGIYEDAGPVFKISAGSRLFVQGTGVTCNLQVVYCDRSV